jgi:hypothetical protein
MVWCGDSVLLWRSSKPLQQGAPRLLRDIFAYAQGVLGMAWCPQDSSLLLSSGKDQRTIVWDVASSDAMAELPPGPDRWHFDLQVRFASCKCGSDLHVRLLRSSCAVHEAQKQAVGCLTCMRAPLAPWKAIRLVSKDVATLAALYTSSCGPGLVAGTFDLHALFLSERWRILWRSAACRWLWRCWCGLVASS